MSALIRSSAVLLSLAFATACAGRSSAPIGAASDGGTGPAPGAAHGPGLEDDVDASVKDDGATVNDGSPDRGAADASEGGGSLPVDASRFAAEVVSVDYGAGAGFGQNRMPDVVLGPPIGGGAMGGGLDVLSLGAGGEIVLRFGRDVVDGPGADFLVFENAFYIGGDPAKPVAELAEVSVSEDGGTWYVFPCYPVSMPYTGCAGWHAVLSTPANGVSATDPSVAGGDPFDLADVGLQRVRFVRVRDLATTGSPSSAGFDLDAVAVVNAEN